MESLSSVPKLSDVERDHILWTLNFCAGNRTHASRLLAISIRGLRGKLKQYAKQGWPIAVPAGSPRAAEKPGNEDPARVAKTGASQAPRGSKSWRLPLQSIHAGKPERNSLLATAAAENYRGYFQSSPSYRRLPPEIPSCGTSASRRPHDAT